MLLVDANSKVDAGYENYTVKFTPREKGTVFSSFYVTASKYNNKVSQYSGDVVASWLS